MTPYEKGKVLEKAVERFLRDMGFRVYSWEEWARKNEISAKDLGGDLVAEKDGKIYLVQCKNWERRVGWNDLGSFIGLLHRYNFDGGYIFAREMTSDAYKNLPKNVIFISIERGEFQEYLEEAEALLQGKKIEKRTKELRQYQKEAIRRIIEGFKEKDRGQLLMPPGTGKTLVALKVAESLGKGKTILFLCPSIALLDQTILAWTWDSEIDINAYAVVSDKKVGRGKEDEDDLNDIRLLSHPATTDPEELVKMFKREEDKLNVIFSTYQSLDVIREAQKMGLPEFDLIICDEAHKTAGIIENEEESSFKLVHSNEHIKGKKRLYMTATPKIYTFKEEASEKEENILAYSMDDEEIFGPVFYEYTFAKAIKEGYITGFKVIAFMVPKKEIQENLSEYLMGHGKKGEDEQEDKQEDKQKDKQEDKQKDKQEDKQKDKQKNKQKNKQKDKQEDEPKDKQEDEQKDGPLSVDDTTKLIGLMKFMKGETLDEDNQKVIFPIKSGIIFVNRLKESKRIARDFVEVYMRYFKEEPKFEIKHIEGNMPAEEKRLKIESLRKASLSKPVILTNAKVLTEGIDVPSLDFVAFFRPKKSEIDIIQALGRVVRRSPGKEYGLIFIPVVIDTEKGNIDEQIDRTNYKTIWQVINAVIAYDETYRVKIRIALLSKRKVSEGLDREIRDNQPDFDEEVFQIVRSPSFPIDLSDGVRKNLTTKVIKTFRIGDRVFLSDWAEETAKLAQILRDQILIAYENDGNFREKFENLESTLSKILNESISTNDCVSLIVQYLLTKPILDAIFTQKSEIDLILDEMFEYFRKFLESNIKDLEKFYEKVRTWAEGILDEENRQELLRFLYTGFFSKAFKDITDEMGIAYTPVPLVSFIVKFVDFLTKKHFGKGLGDEGVVILEPFAGMGTFVALLIDHIAKEDKGKVEGKLKRKEIWANEILLLPYLIMLKNVESTLFKNLGRYTPFTTALWTDSFNLMEKLYDRKPKDLIGFPQKFKEMVEAQLNAKVNVIISNPPWRARRENENVGRKNVEYPNLRRRIGETYAKYAKELGTTNVNSLYDTYIQALRMATDRIEEGVIGLVLNNGWLYGLSGRGIRKALSEEFAEVYVYDLKGDARKRGGERRREAENVFGDQSRAGVCLLFLVKKKNKTAPAKIYYKAVKDYAKKEEKFAELKEWEEKPDQIPWEEIVPNKYHDWLEQGEEEFENLLKLGDKRNEKEITVFGNYSLGLKTNRDSYAYNSSFEELKKNMGRLIETFNEHLERVWRGEIKEDEVEEKIEKDIRKIKWDYTLKKWLFKIDNPQEFRDNKVFPVFYRPFIPMYVYFDRVFNASVYQLPSIFPTPSHQNLAIAVSGKGSDSFDAFITDRIVSIAFLSPTQLFPLYVYEEQQMMGEKRLVRLYNITDEALNKFRDEIKDRRIEKEHIFYYVFGVLSTPEYVKRYENNLKKDLPRVPILQSFWDIAYLGEELAKLQLNYQNLPEYEDENLRVEGDWDPEEFVVDAKLDEKNKVMVINNKVKVYGIPNFAFEYRVGGYPPIRWICDYMKRNEDKESGIVWDPKIKVGEFISLTRKLITLSKRTLEIKQRLSEVIMLP
jgi:predicted helicase